MQRLIQRMIDKYQNFYKERTPSRERAEYPNVPAPVAMNAALQLDTSQERAAKEAMRKKKEDIQRLKAQRVEESLGLRDPVQNLEADLSSALNNISNLSSTEKSKNEHDFSNPQFI